MDKVINVSEEIGEGFINTKSGKRIPVKTKTIYTTYESGRKDCNVEIEKPLNLFGDSKQ